MKGWKAFLYIIMVVFTFGHCITFHKIKNFGTENDNVVATYIYAMWSGLLHPLYWSAEGFELIQRKTK